MRIDLKELGGEHPPIVIAEIGNNHDGSLRQAEALTKRRPGRAPMR